MNVLNKICMAFMTQLLPPEMRAKILEKNPTTMAQSAKYGVEAQRLIRDKSRLIGTTTAKPWVLAIQENLDADDLDALVLNVVDCAFKKRNFNPGSRNQGRLAASNGTKPKSQKQCTYCRKTGHGQDDCYACKNDKAPCFNSKGDPYYPKSDADWKGPPTDQQDQPPLSYPKARVFPTGSEFVPDSGPQKDLQLRNVCMYILNHVNKRFLETLHFLFSMGTR